MVRRAGLGLAWWLVTAAADAEGEPLSLAWVAPETCPTRAEVVARVHAHLGDPSLSLPRTSPTVFARVTEVATGYALELEWTLADASESRHVEAATCEELARAAALVIALAIDPNARLATTQAPSAEGERSTDGGGPAARPSPPDGSPAIPADAIPPATRPPTTPPPKATAPEAPGTTPNPRRAPRAWSGGATAVLEGGLEVGALPEPAVGVGSGVEVWRGPIALGLVVRWFGVAEAENAAGRGHFSEGMLAVLPCATQRWTRFGLSECVTTELTATYARGIEVDSPDTRLAWNMRLGAGVRGHLAVGRGLRLGVGAWMLAVPARPPYTLGGMELFQPEPVQARVLAGIEYGLERGRLAE